MIKNTIYKQSIFDHLDLVNPMMLPYSLKHFLQRRRSYFLMRPIWHLQFLHSLLSLP